MIQYSAIAFAVTFSTLFLLLRTRIVNLALDKPNHRSLHTEAIPRIGGLAIIAGVIIVWSLVTQEWLWLMVLVFLTVMSLVDDMQGLRVGWRLLAQVLACMLWILEATPFISWWVLVLMLLTLVWAVNLYNFMDGVDGLAGGMALFGFAFYGLAAYLAGDMHFCLMSICVAASALAFLTFNFYPASIFMGDAGSVPLGFLAATMGFYGWQHGLWPAWFSLLVFSPFIVDSTITLLRRLLLGEKIWQAHRSHYYQRLVQMGWGHRKTALVEYCLMLAAGASAIFLLKQTTTLVMMMLAVWGLFYLVVMCVVDKRWSTKKISNNAF